MTMVAQGAVPAVERSHLWPFWLALAVVLIAVPLVRRVAVARAWYDHPDGGLKPHEKPIPYLGGVGIYAGWLAAILAAVVLSDQYRVQLVWIAAGGTVLTVTGLIDDVRHVPPKARLFIQAAVGGGCCMEAWAGASGRRWQSRWVTCSRNGRWPRPSVPY